LTGDPERENESEGAGGWSEEAREYATERVRSLCGSLLKRNMPWRRRTSLKGIVMCPGRGGREGLHMEGDVFWNPGVVHVRFEDGRRVRGLMRRDEGYYSK
jgi:hypothetical protein